ncbi:hypothetical protein [Phycicoccus avicenniae]|uniref:hypothetical protein n=1 Tax=Phycicoccus avicenniae TaxID=2828860 RepID=UPI003D272E7A
MVDGWQGSRGGRRWEEDLDGVLRPDRWRNDEPTGSWGEPWGGYSRGESRVSDVDLLSTRRDEVTTIVLIGDRVVDVLRTPVHASEYACAALELEDRRPPPPPPVPPGHELQLAWLATAVGGADALSSLTGTPLPDEEELRLDGVEGHRRERAEGIERRLAGPALEMLGAEGLTATRRLLARLVRDDPYALLRGDRDDTTAAALVWAVARGNDLAGAGRPLRSRDVQEVFGLRSAPSSRATSLAHAVGGGPAGFSGSGYYGSQSPDVVPLGDPALLLGVFRRRVIGMRDRALVLRERTGGPDMR